MNKQRNKISITLTFLFLMCLVSHVFGQQREKKYCEVVMSYSVFGKAPKQPVIKVDYRPSDSTMIDSVSMQQLKQIASLKSSVQVCNYMEKIGWKFVSMVSINGYNQPLITLIFNKEFAFSE